MHVSAKSFRETWTVCFAQGTNARPAVLMANFTTLVATPMIESHTGTLSGH